jgi:hypothetical protein
MTRLSETKQPTGGLHLKMRRVSGKKIAIPSDPEIRLQALSIYVERSCELSLPKARKLSACETLASLGHHTEVSLSR